MKIFISLDMEGIAGICMPSQVTEDRAVYRRCLHDQIAWVIEGIQASKANDSVEAILIADSHGDGTNLVYQDVCAMDDRLSLVSGSPRQQFMMAGLDSSYDVCIFVGYHAGSNHLHADMDHSYAGKPVDTLYINGSVMNESTVNAALAGEYGVPVGLVVGDSALREELIDQGMLPWVSYVETKRSLGFKSAMMRPAAEVRAETVAKVAALLDSDLTAIPLYRVENPCELKIRFRRSVMADLVCQVPGCVRHDGTTVSVVCRDMRELIGGITALTMLAGCA